MSASKVQHVRIEKGSFKFSGDCPNCWTVCNSVCCRVMFVPLADEEIATGKYETMKHEGATFLKRSDEGCTYLKGNKCSIYLDRPVACRKFDCSQHTWRMIPLTAEPMSSGLPLKAPVVKWEGQTYHFSTYVQKKK